MPYEPTERPVAVVIPWDGPAIHAAIQAYLRAPKTEAVSENRRCVNEGSDGCSLVASANGWCPECWSGIDPAAGLASER